MLFKLKPNKYITPKLAINERGTAILGMIVEEKVLRKKNITNITKNIANARSKLTSLIDARMVMVLSLSIETFIDFGKASLS